MKSSFLFVICLLCGASFAWSQSLSQSAAETQSKKVEVTALRRSELIRLVRQDCGSCHGLSLKGGLGPALLPETLRDQPAESLLALILHGRPGTPMPPWKQFLNEDEARWIVEQLQRGFPHEDA